MTVTRLCKCSEKEGKNYAAVYQDKLYGKGMRVCNISQNGKVAKCTVCGTDHRLKD